MPGIVDTPYTPAGPPAANARVFISEQTGAGPWTWTGLNGDEAGLRGYEIVCRFTKAANLGANHNIRLRFNGDTGANYLDGSFAPVTSAYVTDGNADGGETIQGTIHIPFARSGASRNLVNKFTVSSVATTYALSWPDFGGVYGQAGTQAGAWTSTAAITSISVFDTVGVDSGVLALYKLMDVP